MAVVEAVEGDTRRTACVMRDWKCNADNPCEVHDVFAEAQKALVGCLTRASLASVVETGDGKMKRWSRRTASHADDLIVRRIQPSDRELLPDFYASLSLDSRYARFLGQESLSDDAVRSFCTPDHTHDEGFVALLRNGESREWLATCVSSPRVPGGSSSPLR